MHTPAGQLTALGWFSCALYLVAAGLAIRAAVVCRQRQAVLSRSWAWLAVGLALLGLNKHFTLQTWLIELGRRVASHEGVTAHSRWLHMLFFLGCALAFTTCCVAFVWRWRTETSEFCRHAPLATAGCGLIGIYISIRIVSITHVDQMLRFDLRRIPLLWLMEAGGLLLIIIQTVCGLQSARIIRNSGNGA